MTKNLESRIRLGLIKVDTDKVALWLDDHATYNFDPTNEYGPFHDEGRRIAVKERQQKFVWDLAEQVRKEGLKALSTKTRLEHAKCAARNRAYCTWDGADPEEADDELHDFIQNLTLANARLL